MFEEKYTGFFRRFFESQFMGNASIAVVGVGGGGGNAVNNMVQKGIDGVDFIAVNTDSQVLSTNKAGRRIQVGTEQTGGLGAGARPKVGTEAVEESREMVKRALEPYDMVFVTAGMGGGTGTGGTPVVASIAQELDILTVGIVTRPFECEGPRRQKVADEGVDELRENVDTLLVISNERLLEFASDGISLEEAFWMVDEVLYDATRGIVDLITHEGLVNLDFADVERTMSEGGEALLGISNQFSMRQHRTPRGKARPTNGSQRKRPKGASRPEEAAIEAISSPLFDRQSIQGADKVLVNVTGGPSLGFQEALSATEAIQADAGESCEVIFGAVTDEDLEGQFQVTVIATGLVEEEQPPNPAVQVPSSEKLDESGDGDGHVDGDSTPLVSRENGKE